MKALIFAAGLGTRLRPLTDDRPKAMVEIAGKPMLQHVIERVAAAGFDDITINIHHYGQMIIDFLEQNNNFGVNIHISDERGLLLDTGGGILKARQWLDGDEPFLVHNTDIISTLDLKAFYNYHVEHDALATILVKERQTQRYLLLDGIWRIAHHLTPHLPSPGTLPPQGRREVLDHTFLCERLQAPLDPRLSP